MSARKRYEVPGSLSRLAQRFAAWLNTRVSGQRIPENLWKSLDYPLKLFDRHPRVTGHDDFKHRAIL